MIGGQRRYQIFLQSENSDPIDVYLVSQERIETAEEQPQEAEDELILADKVLLDQNQVVDTSGLLKISPDTDYYLNTVYEGISDYYTEDAYVTTEDTLMDGSIEVER